MRDTDDTIYTTGDIADDIQVSDRTVVNWIRRGLLPAMKVGGLYRIEGSDYADFKVAAKAAAVVEAALAPGKNKTPAAARKPKISRARGDFAI